MWYLLASGLLFHLYFNLLALGTWQECTQRPLASLLSDVFCVTLSLLLSPSLDYAVMVMLVGVLIFDSSLALVWCPSAHFCFLYTYALPATMQGVLCAITNLTDRFVFGYFFLHFSCLLISVPPYSEVCLVISFKHLTVQVRSLTSLGLLSLGLGRAGDEKDQVILGSQGHVEG